MQLAEGFDVFMPKSQLDSILSNYTRSGSLLFRKLVCAFFDDKTLANSLPNGKRKRGLNDNRKGLDQNIVGAIKGMFFAFFHMCNYNLFSAKESVRGLEFLTCVRSIKICSLISIPFHSVVKNSFYRDSLC